MQPMDSHIAHRQMAHFEEEFPVKEQSVSLLSRLFAFLASLTLRNRQA
jgi:hypothetical protein